MSEMTSHRLCLVARVVFQPVALVGSIVGMVGRVTDVEVSQSNHPAYTKDAGRWSV